MSAHRPTLPVPHRLRALMFVCPAAVLLGVLVAGAAAAASLTAWEGDRPIPTPEQAARAAAALVVKPSLERVTPARVTGDPGPAGTWSLVGPPSGVQRFEPAVVFDPVRQRLLSFGGADSLLRSDVYAFSLASGTWSRLTTAGTPPPARRLHGAVYDPLADRVVVLGGYDEHGLFADVWLLSLSSATPTWSELLVPPGPSARAGFVSAFDAANDRVIVFGGYDGITDSTGLANDVWALSLAGSPAWSEIVPEGTPPAGRLGMVGGYDAGTHALYVFGGDRLGSSSELWKLSLDGTPAWSLVAAANDPGARAFGVGGFDPVSHQFAVSCGYRVQYDVLGDWITTTYADVWTIDPAAATPTWQDVTPDPTITPRWGSGGTVSPAGDLYVVAGVTDRGQLITDVWKINIATPTAWHTWEDLFPPRLQEVMVMDTKRHRLVAFGGTDGSYRNDTYVHSLDFGRGWAPLLTSGPLPPPRRLGTGIYDPVGDRLIVFGGYNDTFLDDTWQLSFATAPPTWSPMAVGTPPSPRAGHVSVYDPVGRRMIVSQGYDGATLPNYRVSDTWALSLDGTPAWTQLATGPGPSARSSASAVYDDAAGSMVVFGGTNPSFLDETWSLSLGDPPAWSQIATAVTPPAREEQSAIYDTGRDRMVIFGGYDTPTPYSHNFDDLWSLGFTGTPQWAELYPLGRSPSPRWGMKSVYDPGADGMWMYGGWDYTYSQQLWFLQWSRPTAPTAIASGLVQAGPEGAALEWQLPSLARTCAVIERSADGVQWTRVGTRLPDGLALPFVDRGVAPGDRYAWRVVIAAPAGSMVSAPVWLTMPAGVDGPPPVAFGLRAAGRASRPGVVAVRCALPSRGPARVQLLDVAGRVRDARDLTAMEPGEHVVELGHALEPGIFFIRLEGAGRVATLKSLVLR